MDRHDNGIKSGAHATDYKISTNAVNFEDAFEASGHGKFNNLFAGLMGLAMIGIILETLGSSYILSTVECEFNMPSIEKGIFSSAVFIGIVTSSHMWGYLADTKGRKGIIQPALLLSAIVSIISSLSFNSWLLIVLRCITGFLLSAASGNLFAYVGEMHVNSSRTIAITMVSFASSLGLIILPGLAWLVLPLNISVAMPFLNIHFTTWRLYLIICSIPSLVVGILLSYFPESPKYLYVHNKNDEAYAVLGKMYSANSSRPKSEFRIKAIRDYVPDENAKNNSMWNQTIPLFKLPLAHPFLLSCFGQFTVFLLSSGLYLWLPAIMDNLVDAMDDNKTNTVCDAMQKKFQSVKLANTSIEGLPQKCITNSTDYVYIVGMIMGCIFCMCYLIIRFIIDRIGKNKLLTIIMTICGSCTLGLSWAGEYYLILVLFVCCLCSGCLGGVVTSIAVDLFPTQHRGMAISLSLMAGRIGAVVGANLSGFLLENYCNYTFFVFGGEVFVFIFASFFFPKPEAIKEKLKNKGIEFN